MESNCLMIEVFKNNEVCCLSHGTREFTRERFERYVKAVKVMGNTSTLGSIYLITVKSEDLLNSIVNAREESVTFKFTDLIESGEVLILDRGINV